MENAGDGGVLPQLRLDDLLAELQARLEAVLSARDRMHGLLEAVIAIGSGLDLEAMLRRIVEAAGGTTENILKLSFYVRDKNLREHINKEWLAMFPDPHSRPARHTFQSSDMAEGVLVTCDVIAVFS